MQPRLRPPLPYRKNRIVAVLVGSPVSYYLRRAEVWLSVEPLSHEVLKSLQLLSCLYHTGLVIDSSV